MRISLEHERLVRMIKESISLMCKSSLSYDLELNVEGLLGITLDKKDIFLVNINESFQSDLAPALPAVEKQKRTGSEPIEIKGEEENMPSCAKKRRSRRRSRNSPDIPHIESFEADFELPDFSSDHHSETARAGLQTADRFSSQDTIPFQQTQAPGFMSSSPLSSGRQKNSFSQRPSGPSRGTVQLGDAIETQTSELVGAMPLRNKSEHLDFGEIVIKEEVDGDNGSNDNADGFDLVESFAGPSSYPASIPLPVALPSQSGEQEMSTVCSSGDDSQTGHDDDCSQISQGMASSSNVGSSLMSSEQWSLSNAANRVFQRGNTDTCIAQDGNTSKQCHYCGSSFNLMSEYQKHMNWHLGKEYTCKYCGKKFSTSYNMRRHIGGVHEKLKFECPTCDKVFSQQDNLRVHQKVACIGK